MKKTYETAKAELVRIAVEDILAESPEDPVPGTPGFDLPEDEF